MSLTGRIHLLNSRNVLQHELGQEYTKVKQGMHGGFYRGNVAEKIAPSAFCQGEAGADYKGLTRLGLNPSSLRPQTCLWE